MFIAFIFCYMCIREKKLSSIAPGILFYVLSLECC